MSLDVTLYAPETSTRSCVCSECGHAHERVEREALFTANITHNLGAMADKAGLYEALWRPEEINCKTASDLIPQLTEGLLKLRSRPAEMKLLNPSNGWGTYENLESFASRYLAACIENPTAIIEACR